MHFDFTINIVSILNAVVLLVGFAVAFTRIGGRIDLLAQRLVAVELAVKDSRDFEKRLTINEERITNHGRQLTTISQDVSDLRRGDGFITNSTRGTA